MASDSHSHALANPNELLADLVRALDRAYISSWQSTAEWQKELNAARDYIDAMRRMHDCTA